MVNWYNNSTLYTRYLKLFDQIVLLEKFKTKVSQGCSTC